MFWRTESGMSSSFLELRSSSGEAADVESSPLPDPSRQGLIRAELLGLERLEGQARRLAEACILAPRQRVSSPLLKRFMENRRVLIRAEREILGHNRPEVQGIDADWLADNFHIVDEVLREVAQDLPRGYDAVLPKLAVAPARGLSPGLRPGPGAGRPHRQRARRGADHAVRPGVPGRSRR